MTWGVLLETGVVVLKQNTRAAAKASKAGWNQRRREAIARKDLVYGRQAIGIVHYKPFKPKKLEPPKARRKPGRPKKGTPQ